MNFLLFQIRRLVMFPVELFSPDGLFGANRGGSDRGRALMMGLPALLFAVVGVGLLLWANFGLASSLEDRYKTELEKSTDEKIELKKKILSENRMLQVAQRSAGASVKSGDLELSSDDPRAKEVSLLLKREEIYLQKLNDLNSANPVYMFKLALVALEKGDIGRCLGVMEQIAPLTEAGFVDAHLWLTNYYLRKRETQLKARIDNARRAMIHTELILKKESDNRAALENKVRLLMIQNGDLSEAYEICNELFKKNPYNYKVLLALNSKMGKFGQNEVVRDIAIIRFTEMLKLDKDEGEKDLQKRISMWGELASCYIARERFDEVEAKLKSELKHQSEKSGGVGGVWVKRMLALVYVKHADRLSRDNDFDQQLEYLKLAYEYNSTNPLLLRMITNLVMTREAEVSDRARAIYNPSDDQDPPVGVLIELGMQSLSLSKYEDALKYFERAKKKNPPDLEPDPEVLNNLAYTYVVGDRRDPRHSLTLIDEAIRIVQKSPNAKKYLTHFYDTRGIALMQLNRWNDATAAFTLAYDERPNNTSIVESLIKCNEANGIDAGPWIRRLEEIRKAEAADADVEADITGAGDASSAASKQ